MAKDQGSLMDLTSLISDLERKLAPIEIRI